MNELVVYKDVPEWPGYRGGEDGSVWSCWRRGRGRVMISEWHQLIGSWSYKNGQKTYLCVALSRNKEVKRFPIHIIILMTFRGPKPDKAQGRHFPDRDRSNNRLSNLHWGSASDNQMDRRVHETDNAGERHGLAKLNDISVREIIKASNNGETINDLAKRYNVSMSAISVIKRGEAWKHISRLEI